MCCNNNDVVKAMIERSLLNDFSAIFRLHEQFSVRYFFFAILQFDYASFRPQTIAILVNSIYFMFFFCSFSCWFNRNRFESIALNRHSRKEFTLLANFVRTIQFSIFPHTLTPNTFMTSYNAHTDKNTFTHSPNPLAVCMCVCVNFAMQRMVHASTILMKWLMSQPVHLCSFIIVSIRSLTSAVRIFCTFQNQTLFLSFILNYSFILNEMRYNFFF